MVQLIRKANIRSFKNLRIRRTQINQYYVETRKEKKFFKPLTNI